MVLVKTPVEFVEKSLELLQARPSTTRITTTYNVSKPRTPTPSKKNASTSTTTDAAATATTTSTFTPTGPKGTVTLKTYDPQSGALVKFKTHKLADVGRLIAGLSRLGRSMSGLPDVKEVEMTTAPSLAETAGIKTGDSASGTSTPTAQQQQQQGKGGASKKKKKGKK